MSAQSGLRSGRSAGSGWAVVALVVLALGLQGVVGGPAHAEETAGFTDSFDGAVDADPTYGLNDSLATRQRGSQRGIAYERVSGLWYPAPVPRQWFSQVNDPQQPGTLSLHSGTSAVRLTSAAVAGSSGELTASVTADPVIGDTAAGSWSSLVLDPNPDASGYVTGPTVALSALVRSDGRIEVFQGNDQIAGPERHAVPDGSGRFRITVSGVAGEREATVVVGDVSVPVQLADPFPATTFVNLGAYLADGNMTSTFDDLAVSAVEPPAAPGVRYFGYWGARLTPTLGNHLKEVRGRSNLNWVGISDRDGYVPEVLDDCAPGSCVVSTGNEFFKGCGAGESCVLYPNYQERWNNLAEAVRSDSRLDNVAAFYLLDEPYQRGASEADLTTAARTIKATFPDKRVMMVEAAPSVTPDLTVPAEVDWVGFDQYCDSISDVETTLTTLESAAEGKDLFLLPQAAPLKACGSKPGHSSDADLAALQGDYLELARQHPRVVGLMTFGLWVEGTQASQLPRTIDAHERIGGLITSLASSS